MEQEYFAVAFAQMKLTLNYDDVHEFLVENEDYFRQMENIIHSLSNKDYDVLIFPELAYHKKYDKYFLDVSKNKIIVFGSTYINSENFTIVYNNRQKFFVKKMFNSGVEPAVRFQDNISEKEFINRHLKSHTFVLKGKKFIVLNCAEYYKVAYLIARDKTKSKNLFAFLVPCANNNNQVFLNESMALHNHNEQVHSFIVNSIGQYKGEKYSNGESYVFGKISSFEKMCKFAHRLKHSCNIMCLDDGCYLSYGKYLFKNASTFYRSDNFRHTPKNIEIIKI